MGLSKCYLSGRIAVLLCKYGVFYVKLGGKNIIFTKMILAEFLIKVLII